MTLEAQAESAYRQQWAQSGHEGREILRNSLRRDVQTLRNLLKELHSRKGILRDCVVTLQKSIANGIQFLQEDPSLCECLDLYAACAYELSFFKQMTNTESLHSIIREVVSKEVIQNDVQQWQESGLLWKSKLLREIT